MSNSDKEKVDQAIRDLGLEKPLTDQELDKEVDSFINSYIGDCGTYAPPTFKELMHYARNDYRFDKGKADMGKVARKLQEKLRYNG